MRFCLGRRRRGRDNFGATSNRSARPAGVVTLPRSASLCRGFAVDMSGPAYPLNPSYVMKTDPIVPAITPAARISVRASRSIRSHLFHGCVGALTVVATSAALFFGGCATAPTAIPSSAAHEPDTQRLHAGDVVKISFPRAATLDTTQQIRRDGKLNLYLIGEVQAAELTPAELEKNLVEKYASQLVSKEVRVTLVTSAFTVYVTGAVLRPGRVSPERELTAFEAVMEAGGFDPAKANPKAVAVIRREGDETKNFRLNLQAILDGKQTEQFYLKANDVIYVPERLSLF